MLHNVSLACYEAAFVCRRNWCNVIVHPVRSWQTNPQLAQNVLLLSFGVVHCVIFLNQITDNACNSENSVLHSD